jgi:excisionase family DNA binding protein
MSAPRTPPPARDRAAIRAGEQSNLDASNSNATPRARLLTADELAERWSVPRAHVYRLSRTGRLPVVELGRYYRYRLDAVEAFEAAGGTASNA